MADDDLALAARALFTLGRTFARQSMRDLLHAPSGRAVDLSRVLVAQAVHDGLADPDAEVTVGTVAERLAIDPSTASRLVADAVRDGYLARSASAHDARRARLALTEAGRALVEASRRFQRQVFLEATAGWPAAERDAFARLFVRFAEAVAGRYAEIKGDPSVPPAGSAAAGSPAQGGL
jgi:DNA-binding MarR family transcriptional regulator